MLGVDPFALRVASVHGHFRQPMAALRSRHPAITARTRVLFVLGAPLVFSSTDGLAQTAPILRPQQLNLVPGARTRHAVVPREKIDSQAYAQAVLRDAEVVGLGPRRLAS